MKPSHCFWIFLVAGTLVPLALYFAGHAWAAGAVLVLAFVAEVLVSAITGKQGNDTER